MKESVFRKSTLTKELIAIFVVLVLCVVVLCGCSADGNRKNSESEEKTISIETPYATIKVPETFKDSVTHTIESESPYTLSFKVSGTNAHLFTLIFNGPGQTVVGTIVGDNGNTVIRMNIPEYDSSNSENNNLIQLQNGVNTIVTNLEKDYEFVVGEEVLAEDSETFDIVTSVCTFKYPAKWQGKVITNVSDSGVIFSNNGTVLFTLRFGGEEGFLLGTYGSTPIRIIDGTAVTEEQAAMQQDVNVIIEHLQEDQKFKINSEN